MKESEEDFQTWVIDTLHTAGFLVYHPRPGQSRTGRYSTPLQGDEGFPDIVAAKAGRVIFAELKSERGQIRGTQSAWLAALSQGPAETYLWRSQDREEIMGIVGLKEA